MDSSVKIAFVQDALPFQGGAEKVLAAALEVYPQAPVYTLVYNREAFHGTIIEGRPIHSSFIDRLPGAHKNHRLYLPLMPLALEGLDLGAYDVVLSFSYAVAHAAPTRTDQLHLSYIHTPMRYAWQSLASPSRSNQQPASLPVRLPGWLQAFCMRLFRCWDIAMLDRTDHFLANSLWTASLIRSAYRRQAEVIYPPVDLDRFTPARLRCGDYVCVSRLVPQKKTGLIVEAFNQLGYPLKIVGDGPEKARLQADAGPNIEFLGWQPEQEVAGLLGKAKAFVHAGEEDFGIAMAEAQAAGCPVIAFRRGAAPEVIRAGRTGLLFDDQSVDSLRAALECFEWQGVAGPAEEIRANALRFDRRRFKLELEAFVSEKWAAFQGQNAAARSHPLPLPTLQVSPVPDQRGVYERRD